MSRLSWRAIALLWLALMGAARAQDISLAAYRDGLSAIASDLEAKHLTDAQKHAKALNGARVMVSKTETFAADASILQAIETPAVTFDSSAQIRRIKSVVNALTEGAPMRDLTREPGVGILNTLRRDEALVLPPKDGEIDDGGLIASGYIGAIFHYIGKALRWIIDRIGEMSKWFDSLFPKPQINAGSSSGTVIKTIVIVFAVLLAGLLLRGYLRSRKFKPVAGDFAAVSAPAVAKDADPMSRDSNQWEDYALKLAASGRHREAIRAWYHAVLVLLFRSGVLTYRKGRTNWEYFFSFSQDFAGRREFQELTGSFELEWYGKLSSTAEDAERYGDAAKHFLARSRGGRAA